jgi:hypothetical protein
LLFNSALEYAIRKVQAKQDILKLDVTNRILIYTEDYNILGASVHTATLKKNTEASLVASKEMQVPKTLSLWSCV